MNKNKVNLFAVWQSKSWTTFLYNYLNQDDNFFFSTEKEPHYFCSDFAKESRNYHWKDLFFPYHNDSQYHKIFSGYSNEKYIWDFSTNYLYSKTAASNIFSYNPNAKIIILIREPTSFLFSLHSQYLSDLTENKGDFIDAIDEEENRKKGLNIPKNTRCPSYLFYKNRITEITEWIKRYYDLFPKENIKTIIFEDFKKDNKKYISEIYDFLNVTQQNREEIQVSKKWKNMRKSVRFRFIYSIFQSPRLKNKARKILPLPMYYKLKNTIEKIFFKTDTKKISVHLSHELKWEFRNEVIKLNNYLEEKNIINFDLLDLWDYKKS